MMQMPGSPYSQDALLHLLGQCTVELAQLRTEIALLRSRIAEIEKSSNGTVDRTTDLANPI